MIEQMKPYLPSVLILFAVLYFGVHGLTGERGLLSSKARAELLEKRQAELAHLEDEKQDLEVRVRYLRTGSLSRDLLEERARAVIGFADPRDYVVRLDAATAHNRSETRAG
ncbi:FtsB family cell division protein [Brevundimonas sp. GN22]